MSVGDCDNGVCVSGWSGRVPPGVMSVEVSGDAGSRGEGVCGFSQYAVDDSCVELRGVLVVYVV